MNKLVGSRTVVSLLAFMLLPALWSVDARGGETRITTEQVNEAIQEMQRLAEKEIAQAAVPGLAIAVVFQDQVVYAAGFGVRDVNTREPVNVDTVFQMASIIQTDRLDRCGGTGQRRQNFLGLENQRSRSGLCDVRSLGNTSNHNS